MLFDHNKWLEYLTKLGTYVGRLRFVLINDNFKLLQMLLCRCSTHVRPIRCCSKHGRILKWNVQIQHEE